MLTRQTLRLLDITISSVSLLKVIPYHWNVKTLRLEPTKSKFHLFLWHLNKCTIWLHGSFLIVRCWQSRTIEEVRLINHILQYIFCIMCLIPSMLQLVLTLRRKELPIIWNHMLGYLLTAQDMYMKVGKELIDKKPSRGSEICIVLFLVFTAVHPIMSLALYFNNPYAPVFLTSLFQDEGEPESWSLVLSLAFVEYWFILGVWTSVLPFTIFFAIIFAIIFWLNELKINKPPEKYWTIDVVRYPGHAIRTYRCLQIILHRLNDLGRRYVFVMLNYIAVMTSIMCTYVLIRHHSYLKGIALVALFLVLVCVVGYIVFVNMFLGDCMKQSKGFMSSWTRATNMNELDKALMRASALRQLVKIVFYTVKLLAMSSHGHGHGHH